MDNVDVARLFDEVADLLEILDENPFRVRAYRNAARTIQALGRPLAGLAREDGRTLAELPGIGRDLAGKIVEIVKTGDLALRRELQAKVPSSLVEMMRVAGVGPKRARQFHDGLGIKTLDELEAARRGRLPRLLEPAAIRGDLQVHTDATDGADSLETMVRAGRERGYAYMAITDHTKSLRAAGGMDEARFRRQGRAIDEIRRRRPGIFILKGAEVDVLPDGRLDLDDPTLESLDLVMAAVHSKLGMTAEAMTERVLRALRHPRVRIFAHPTGRLLGSREPYAIDLERVARAAAEGGVLLEINARPERLDLNDVHVRAAKEAGARFVISTDAHRAADLDLMRFGVDQARRGWLEAGEVANTLDLEELRDLIATPRKTPAAASINSRAPAARKTAAGRTPGARDRPRGRPA